MTQQFRIVSLVILPSFALMLGLGIGVSVERQRIMEQQEAYYRIGSGSGEVVRSDPEREVNMSLFWDVWRKLGAYYINPNDLVINDMMYGAIRGMVEGVNDPYTAFMTPSENRDFFLSLNGDLEGIGAELTMRDSAIVVVAPLKQSPAARAGLLPGDVIVSVDDADLAGKRLDEVVGMIRGEQGTRVVLEVYRPSQNEMMTLTITREKVRIPSMDAERIETASGTIGYISLNRFDEQLARDIERALNDFNRQPVDGLILDVRFNGGGLLDAAIDVASFFLREGVVSIVERRGAPPESLYVKGQPIFPDTPMVVLINEGSASASEILAGALRDHGRATLVGAQSFGKGTVQEIVDLPGGASLRVTTAQWLTPSGHNLGKTGLTPDVIVERTPAQFLEGDDPQLERAKELLFE